MIVNQNTLLSELKGVGKTINERLALIGLNTISDLLDYYPKKYEDYSNIVNIVDIRPGKVSIKAKINEVTHRRARRGLHITEAVAVDDTSKVKLIWFNQPYRPKSLKPDTWYYISGEFDFQHQKLQIINPNIEEADTKVKAHTARILPNYKESGVVTSVLIRKLITQTTPIINKIPETLPGWIVKDYDLLPLNEAIKAIHLPDSGQQLQQALERIGFEELFVVMMASQQIKNQASNLKALPIKFNQKIAKDFVANLPFDLTDSQRKVVWQIYKDIEKDSPMNRLVEGDVGSGKTVIAAMASLLVAESNLQVALVAPTELLAWQHANTINELFSHSPIKDKVALLVGSTSQKQKLELKNKLKNNQISMLIGTHALFQQSVDWHKLGLVIIDEQHRFGVEQRQKLNAKAGHMPHVLCLTATPIPRSLALTVYGELDVSIVDQAPSIRAGVDTSVVSPNSVNQMYKTIYKQLDKGHQVYVVCPLINESETLQVASAEEMYKKLKQKEFKNYRVGLLHGKMKSTEKDQIMKDFVSKKIDVLVATTVIEVGVDVSNATTMIINGAERFGLAQLHQLRGRVGRAEHKGHCYLVMNDSSRPSKRIEAFANITNGFELAELDLSIRGPGAIYGIRQHGILDLRVAKLSDVHLIAKTKQAVKAFVKSDENLLKYKQIAKKVQTATKLTNLN